MGNRSDIPRSQFQLVIKSHIFLKFILFSKNLSKGGKTSSSHPQVSKLNFLDNLVPMTSNCTNDSNLPIKNDVTIVINIEWPSIQNQSRWIPI